jgi:hypothetical protein
MAVHAIEWRQGTHSALRSSGTGCASNGSWVHKQRRDMHEAVARYASTEKQREGLVASGGEVCVQPGVRVQSGGDRGAVAYVSNSRARCVSNGRGGGTSERYASNGGGDRAAAECARRGGMRAVGSGQRQDQ